MLLPPLTASRKLLLPVLLILATACRDSSSPPAPVRVALQASVTDGPTIVEGETSPMLQCDLSVEAVATGNGVASWESGALYFYFGRDRSQAKDTIPLTAETVATYWDADTIAAGNTQHMRIIFRAPFPFGVKVEMSYRPASGGPTRTAESAITCGPVAPPGPTQTTISSMTVQPATGQVQRGQSITVEFTANSPLGIRATTVTLSGACVATVRNEERLAPTVTRTVTIPLAQSCRSDVPLVVTLTAEDGALEKVSRVVSMTLTFLD